MTQRINHILVRPVLTEKSMDAKARNNVHVFEVARDANKIEIKAAVEHHFGVKVDEVRTTKVQAKSKRVGRHQGTTSAWKKAYVTVRPDSGEISYFEGT